MRALFFNPHNDDVIIGAGGSLLKLLGKGWEVAYVYLTDGRHGSNTLLPEETKKVRVEEAAKERKQLGIEQFYTFDIEDGTLDKLDENKTNEIKSKIKVILAEYKPDIVFIPSRAEMHSDHRATHDFVWDVVEANKFDGLVAKYLIWFVPDFWKKKADVSNKIICIDINREAEKKLQAIRLHESQVSRGSHDKFVENLNKYLAGMFKLAGTHAEVLALFNRNKNNKAIEEKFLTALENIKEITEIFHGRKEQKIK